MTDLAIFLVLVALVGALGVAIGILVARRLGAWDERRAAARDDGRPDRAPGSAGDTNPAGDGGDALD